VSVPTLIHQSFGGGPAQLGAALTALAAGSLAGTLVRAARGMPGSRALPLAIVIMTCGLAATAAAPALPAVLAGLATAGIGWSCLLGTAIAILQSADPRMLGRVMSLFAVVLLGGTSAGATVASALSASLGPRAPFAVGAAAAAAALAMAARSAGSAGSHPAGAGRSRVGGDPARSAARAVVTARRAAPRGGSRRSA
jgi:MFS family permease